MSVMNGLRRVASAPGLRRVLLQPTVRRLIARALAMRFLIAARRTTEPRSLLLGELLHRGSVRTYVVRSTGVPVVLQHGRDVEALYELFERGEYEPPPALAARLAPPSGRPLRILDIGANVGMFSAWATGRFPGASITAFEPSHESIPLYESWLHETGSDALLVPACAATFDGQLGFEEGFGGGSRQVEGSTPHPAVDIYGDRQDADFVKMDIEGGEWAILNDPRLATLSTTTWVIEYHRHLAPSLPALDAARACFDRAGFTTGHVTANHWGHGTLWAWKD